MQEPEGPFSSGTGWTLPGFKLGKSHLSLMGNLETIGKSL